MVTASIQQDMDTSKQKFETAGNAAPGAFGDRDPCEAYPDAPSVVEELAMHLGFGVGYDDWVSFDKSDSTARSCLEPDLTDAHFA